MKIKTIRPEFVVSFPSVLEEGVLYISEEYETAVHKCCCGCGEKVLTPLNPAKWRVINSSAGVSMEPSIGNWKFPCKAHYWIKNNRVIDAGMMSKQKIDAVKARDKRDNQRYIEQNNRGTQAPSASPSSPRKVNGGGLAGLLKKLGDWCSGK